MSDGLSGILGDNHGRYGTIEDGIESNVKRNIDQALREGNEIKKNVLRLVVGEVQTINSRSGTRIKPIDDEMDRRYINVMKKLVASNTETIDKLKEGDQRRLILGTEIYILNSFIPAEVTPEMVLSHLVGCAEVIKQAKSDGQAVGIAMKLLRSKNIITSGEVVSGLVKKIRSEGPENGTVKEKLQS